MKVLMVDHTGFEPVTPCMSSKCSNRAELMIHRVRMVPETGIEPVTLSLEGSCSIQLSYSGREVYICMSLYLYNSLYLFKDGWYYMENWRKARGI